MDKITFVSDDEQVEFYVLEETRINNTNYILVTDSDVNEDADSEDAQAYIMKDVSAQEETEAVYEFVEDDAELEAVAKVFGEELEDLEIES